MTRAVLRHLWPANLFDLDDVIDWIGQNAPQRPLVYGPLKMHRTKRWSVTADFGLGEPTADATGFMLRRSTLPSQTQTTLHVLPEKLRGTVVFKANLLPRFSSAVGIHDLLTKECPEFVPRLIKGEQRPRQIWMLFEHFDGELVSNQVRLKTLLDMTRSMAIIQTRIARLDRRRLQGLPQAAPARPQGIVDEAIREIESRYMPAFLADEAALLRQHQLPPNLMETILQFRPSLRAWASELQDGDWPLTIDHPELTTENALFTRTRMCILDWDEAWVGLPFFSLERLFEDALILDEGAVIKREGGLNLSPTQEALRKEFVYSFDVRTQAERERALNLALCLSPLKRILDTLYVDNAVGRTQGNPELAAKCVSTALGRWQAFSAG